jgi:hypothetical protein
LFFFVFFVFLKKKKKVESFTQKKKKMRKNVDKLIALRREAQALVGGARAGSGINLSSFDHRRAHRRQRWGRRGQEIAEGDDPDFFFLPRERFGRDYALNWAINSYRMTPTQEAFRNLHLSGLVMLAGGRLDEQKALHFEFAKRQAQEQGGSKKSSSPKDTVLCVGKDIDADVFRQLMRRMRMHMSDVEAIHVHDGALGDGVAAHSRCTARVFTDDARVALFLRHMVGAVPLVDPRNFEHELTAYVLADDGEFDARANVDATLPHSFVAYDADERVAIVVNPSSLITVGHAVTQMAADALKSRGTVVVAANTLVDAANSRSRLVFNPTPALDNAAAGAVAQSQLGPFAEHISVWHADGVSRLWHGHALQANAKSLQRGDLVEHDSAGSTIAFSRLMPPAAPVAPHPSDAIVFVHDAPVSLPPISALSEAQLAKLIARVSPPTEPSVFADRRAANAFTAYAINAKGQKAAQIAKLVASIDSKQSKIPKSPATLFK